MAISHRSTGTVAQGTGTSFTVSAPATREAGDLLLYVVHAVATITKDADIENIANHQDGNAAFRIASYYRVATDDATDDADFTLNTSSAYTAVCICYQDADAAPFDTKADTSQTSTDTTWEIGSPTVAENDSMGVIMIASNTASSMTWPSGYALRFEDKGSARDLFVGDNFNVDSGAHSPGSVTGGANRFAATIAIFKSGSVDTPPVITSDGGGATATVFANEGQTAVTTCEASGLPAPTFSITGGDDAADFSIDTNTGELTFDSSPSYAAAADTDANSVYEVEVTATNSEGSDAQAISVVLNPMYSGTTPDAPLDDAEYFYRPIADHVAGNTQYANHGTRDEPLVLGDDYTADAQDPDWVSDGSLGHHLAYTNAADSYAFAEAPQAIIDAASFTVAVRVRFDVNNVTMNLFNVMKDIGTDSKTIFLHRETGTNVYYGRIWDGTTDSQVEVTSTTTSSTSRTDNVVVTYDGTAREILMYVNGAEEDSNTSTNARRLRGSDYYLEWPVGVGHANPALCPTCKYFRMAFWDRCLDASEVADLETNAFWIADDAGGLIAPTITSSATFNAAENQTTVGTVTADGDPTPTFSITGGADSALFAIDTNSGALTFTSGRNYESPTDANADGVYVVQVTATNSEGTDDQTISVTVTNANEAPTLVTLSGSHSVPDGTDTTGGYVVGTLTTTDPDAANTHTYTIQGGADQASFTIENDDELVLDDGTLDAGTQDEYVVIVRSTDQGALTRDETFTITVVEGGLLLGPAYSPAMSPTFSPTNVPPFLLGR